jgi:cytochrome b561
MCLAVRTRSAKAMVVNDEMCLEAEDDRNGWLNASGRGWSVRLAGRFNLPQIATADSFGASLGEWHSASAIILLILVGLHVFTEIAHQLLSEDDVLGRML